MHTCHKCSAEVYKTEKFCHACGAPLSWTKPKDKIQSEDEWDDVKRYLSRGKIVSIVIWSSAWIFLLAGIGFCIYFIYQQNIAAALGSLAIGIFGTPFILAFSEMLNELIKIRTFFESRS